MVLAMFHWGAQLGVSTHVAFSTFNSELWIADMFNGVEVVPGPYTNIATNSSHQCPMSPHPKNIRNE
eukprot:3771697-Amphidinium_carterae.1